MNYSIGVVTYHARFESYFKPLIEKLSKVFPDKEIICIANGHPDIALQSSYLNKFGIFLDGFKNVRYFKHEDNQSLSKCWNQVIVTDRTEGCLMLNDDTQVSELFRNEFEKKIILDELPFSTINGSWSHFFITKKIIREVGWFDENFIGVGNEDVDYMFRMAIKGLTITDSACLGIDNYVAPAENPSWKEVSEITDKKYSATNKEHIKSKYFVDDFNPEITKFEYLLHWKNGTRAFTPKNIDIKCSGYTFDLLKNDANINLDNKPFKIGFRLKTKIFFQKIKYGFLFKIKELYRLLKSKYNK